MNNFSPFYSKDTQSRKTIKKKKLSTNNKIKNKKKTEIITNMSMDRFLDFQSLKYIFLLKSSGVDSKL